MNDTRLNLLKHLVKIGAFDDKVDVTEFLDKQVKRPNGFVLGNMLKNMMVENLIKYEYGYKEVLHKSQMPTMDIGYAKVRITSQGEVLVKSFTNNKDYNKLNVVNLVINGILALCTVISLLYLHNTDKKNDNLTKQLTTKRKTMTV